MEQEITEPTLNRPDHRFRQKTFCLAFAALSAGIVFYALVRLDPSSRLATLMLQMDSWSTRSFSVESFNAIPSLCQAVFITLMLLLCASPDRRGTGTLVLLNLGLMSAGEALLGTFSWFDLAAILVGTTLSLYWWTAGLRRVEKRVMIDSSSPMVSPRSLPTIQKGAAALVLSASVFGITGTAPYDPGARYSPVYMDYQTLRNSVAQGGRRNFGDVGRLYLYGDYLFLNERNIGIHVIDNSNPFDPQKISFIAIPGNTEISIRSNNLYANSYVDLVTLSIGDIENIQETTRVRDIFPYDAYQNVPSDIYFDDIDETRGVVVGYR